MVEDFDTFSFRVFLTSVDGFFLHFHFKGCSSCWLHHNVPTAHRDAELNFTGIMT